MTNDEFPFLDMKISWSPEGDLQFIMFSKKGQQLKYVVKESTHTPGTLHTIPSGVSNCLAKITSRKKFIHSDRVEKIYPNHVNALHKAGLAPYNFPTMGDLWSKQDEKVNIEKEPEVKKRKHKCLLLCCLLKLLFCVYPQGGQQAKNIF